MRLNRLNATLFGRANAIVRDGRYIRDRAHAQSAALNGADRGFASGARPLDEDIDFLHPLFFGIIRGLLGGDAGGIGRALAAALKACGASAGPCDHVALLIAHGHDGVVECGVNMRLPVRYILPGLLLPATTRASPSRCSGSTSHALS